LTEPLIELSFAELISLGTASSVPAAVPTNFWVAAQAAANSDQPDDEK
jgi:hypothetical protein